ncbi:hypothetical protein AAHA92_09479 [Salvia divinorum]|uniref:Uncharacterized protein n=1 Tax=Salvia divinorum TaxID=28513 RepID=A0ABD1HRL2_SALDI
MGISSKDFTSSDSTLTQLDIPDILKLSNSMAVSGSLNSETNVSEDDSKVKQSSDVSHAAYATSMHVESIEVNPSHLENAPAHNRDHMMSWKDVVVRILVKQN